MTKTARLYGSSLYDLAVEESLAEEILTQAQQTLELFRETPEYLRLLGEPSLSLEERCGLLDQAFGSSMQKYLLNFLKLLCEKGLLGEFGGCCEEMERRYMADHNISKAVVYAAVSLSEAQKQALTSKLEKMSGKSIRMEVKQDPSVIGGLRVELDGQLLDGTLQGRLQGLNRTLNG